MSDRQVIKIILKFSKFHDKDVYHCKKCLLKTLEAFGAFFRIDVFKVEMMLSEEGLRDDERARGFNSKIVVSYDVHLVEGDAFT